MRVTGWVLSQIIKLVCIGVSLGFAFLLTMAVYEPVMALAGAMGVFIVIVIGLVPGMLLYDVLVSVFSRYLD